MKLFVYGEFGPMAMENALLPTWRSDAAVEGAVPIARLPLPRREALVERGLRRYWPRRSAQIRAHNAHVLHTVESQWTVASALLVFKGMELFPETLADIRALGVRMFCYNPDHPFVYAGHGSGTEFMRQSLPIYDRYFTYHRGAQAELTRHGIPNALIPFGYEPEAMAEPFVAEAEEILRGCFIGNPNPMRVRLFKELEERIPLDVYGNGWAKYFGRSPHIRVHGPVHGAEHWKTMARYRFQLNVMAEHNPDAHNMRTFAAAAAGAILVAPRNEDHMRYFKDGREIVLYDQADDCAERCEALLGMAYEAALQIRQAARQRSLDSGYAYSERAQALLKHMLETVH